MYITRQTVVQLAIFATVALVAGAIMIFGYIRLPALLFGVGRYTVTVDLAQAAGLYENANVTYRGSEVGQVTAVRLTDTGAQAVLSLRSGVAIPSDLQAEVHSVSGIGEQYVALLPQNATAAPLKDGDVIPVGETSVPPDINTLLDATNRGLQAIPQDNLKTVIDESYTAVGGLGPEISRIVKGSTALAIDARANLGPLTTLIDQAQPVLDSQADSSDAIKRWAANIATVTNQLQANNSQLTDLIEKGGPAAEEGRQLFERLRPTLPILMANLVSVADVAVAYQPAIEQILVLLPEAVQHVQAIALGSGKNMSPSKRGLYLDFNLNVNLPPPCVTGFLPPQQMRSATVVDAPDRPAGDLYCRVPQDSSLVAVRGAHNYPCLTVPGKRAPTARMCESDQQYVPLNDGTSWKGDPNATLSGQGVPQRADNTPPAPAPPPSAVPAPPGAPLAVAEYDPATGTYVGPDGKVYTQANLAATAGQERTWQSMMLPPAGP